MVALAVTCDSRQTSVLSHTVTARAYRREEVQGIPIGLYQTQPHCDCDERPTRGVAGVRGDGLQNPVLIDALHCKPKCPKLPNDFAARRRAPCPPVHTVGDRQLACM